MSKFPIILLLKSILETGVNEAVIVPADPTSANIFTLFVANAVNVSSTVPSALNLIALVIPIVVPSTLVVPKPISPEPE